jgi:hypothetical protein
VSDRNGFAYPERMGPDSEHKGAETREMVSIQEYAILCSKTTSLRAKRGNPERMGPTDKL